MSLAPDRTAKGIWRRHQLIRHTRWTKETMNALNVAEAALLLADPLAYTDDVRLHTAMALLREHARLSQLESSDKIERQEVISHALVCSSAHRHVKRSRNLR